MINVNEIELCYFNEKEVKVLGYKDKNGTYTIFNKYLLESNS